MDHARIPGLPKQTKVIPFSKYYKPPTLQRTPINGICGRCGGWKRNLLMYKDPPPTFVCSGCAGVRRGA